MKNAIISLLCFTLSACAGSPASKKVLPIQEYTLGIGDEINVTVYGHDDLSGKYKIEPDGVISLPLVRDIPASGHTSNQLEHFIAEQLSPDYIVDARVSVEVATFRNIYVLGEVRTPGKYEYAPNMTLLQAIATAGGYTYRANEGEAEITRHIKDSVTTFNVDDKTIIKPGDTVVVGRRWF